MALNFPATPSTGDIHNASNNLSYYFDGVKWITQGSYNTGTINTIKLDSITSSFNGSLTTFNLTSNSISVKPANAQSVMISLGGVIQEPTTAYTINSETGTITFASAPASSTAFFGILYSRLPQSTTTVDDGAITNAKVNATAAIAQSKLNIADATTSASGFMSASDKTKLDGIQAGGGSGISDVVSDTTPQLGGNLDVQTNEITTSTSNGNIKLIPNGTGVVEIKGDGSSADGTIQLNCSQNSHGVKLKSPPHSANASYTLTLPNTDGNANQVLKTDGAGNLDWVDQTDDQTASEIIALVADQTIAPSEIDMEDNEKIKLGTGDDLSLFHNGTDSFIENITGNLHIRPKSGEEGIKLFPDGSVYLYYDNAIKTTTAAWGLSIWGIAQGNSLEASNGYIHVKSDNQPLKIGAGSDLSLLHDGTDSKITNITGNLLIEPKASETGIKVIPDGAVELYHDNVKKVETTSSGITVTGSVTTQDMNMSNLNGTANEVDSTKGSWSIQEGSEDLFLINRVSGKKYKFNLTEIS